MRKSIAVRLLFATWQILYAAEAFLQYEAPVDPQRGTVLHSFPTAGKGENGISRRQALDKSFAVAASGLLLPKTTLASDDLSTNSNKVKIPTIKLGGGKSTLEVSRTIQGYWQLAGGHGNYREVDAIENMKAHFDAGITTLDTADIYGPSELVVGKFVKSQAGAIPCTKFCCFRYLEVSFCATNLRSEYYQYSHGSRFRISRVPRSSNVFFERANGYRLINFPWWHSSGPTMT